MEKSLFTCPICAAPLERGERAYACPNGHAYDKAREGYVNLLPANKKHSKAPGDDRGMAEARRRFLSGGYYGHLLAALCALGAEYAPPGEAVLDSGCGEGYYTAGLWEALGRPPLAGIDLSKPSVRLAARRCRRGVRKGTYYLKETKAPDGYRLLKDPIVLKVIPTYTDKRDEYVKGQGATNTTLQKLEVTAHIKSFYDGSALEEDQQLETEVEDGSANLTVVNRVGSKLPVTGTPAMAALLLTGCGCMLISIVLVKKKGNEEKMNAESHRNPTSVSDWIFVLLSASFLAFTQ